MSGSPGARHPAEKLTTTAGELGDDERSASVEDGSVITREAMAGTAGPSRAETGVAGIAPEYGSTEPDACEELMAPPKVVQGMVRPAVQPKSPPVVLPAPMEEEDVVEEIIRAEPQT